MTFKKIRQPNEFGNAFSQLIVGVVVVVVLLIFN